MFFILISTVIGLALGIAAGYFLVTWLVVLLTVLWGLLVWDFFRTKPGVRKGSGHLGAFLMCAPGMICFIASLWITFLFAGPPSGVMPPHINWNQVLHFFVR